MSNIMTVNISKFYERKVLDSFSLTSKENEFITILGPSGSGKSTLLRCIAGLEKPTTGEIYISGKNVSEFEPGERNIAMVFQSYALYPNLSVYENIALYLKCQKVNRTEINERVLDVAGKLEITDLLYKKPNKISGGERQRVAIAKAIVRKPDVFLFDEPLANLDVNLKEKARKEFQNLHKSQNAVFVYVTHDQKEAMSLGDRIIVMNNGVIQQIDTPYNVYENPNNRFVAEFVGEPKINFISKSVFYILTNKSSREFNNDLDIAIRPEKIKIDKDAENTNAIVESIENLGKDNAISVLINDNIVTLCVDANIGIGLKEKDKICCKASINDFLYFNSTTGERILNFSETTMNY